MSQDYIYYINGQWVEQQKVKDAKNRENLELLAKYLNKLSSQADFKISESTEKSLKGESNLYNKTLEKNKKILLKKLGQFF